VHIANDDESKSDESESKYYHITGYNYDLAKSKLNSDINNARRAARETCCG
jgi:hypothetical protein